MQDYIFEFEISGSISIKANSKEKANKIYEKICDKEKLLKKSDGYAIESHFTGEYKKDSSIKYYD